MSFLLPIPDYFLHRIFPIFIFISLSLFFCLCIILYGFCVYVFRVCGMNFFLLCSCVILEPFNTSQLAREKKENCYKIIKTCLVSLPGTNPSPLNAMMISGCFKHAEHYQSHHHPCHHVISRFLPKIPPSSSPLLAQPPSLTKKTREKTN